MRPLLLTPILATATLLTAAPVAASPTAASNARHASIEFDLPADNGLRAHLETFNGEVTLEIERKGRFVSYEVLGESTEAGLKAQFGALGRIDVAFEPIKTRLERPPKGCRGPPSSWSEGIFVGIIEFTGELEYVRIETTQTRGTMWVSRTSEWHCPRHKKQIRFHDAPQRATVAARGRPKVEGEPAILWVTDRRQRYLFGAATERDRRGHGQSHFFGARFEKREGMEIYRVTSAVADASAFVFDHAAGTARVRPPRPFNGGGTYKRRLHKRDLWRGSIRFPILGAEPLTIRGRGVRAALTRHIPGD